MSADTTLGLALRDAEAVISQYCYATTDYGDTSVFKTKRVLDMVRRAFEMGRTAQAASGEPVARKPLTDEQVYALADQCEKVNDYAVIPLEFARIVEAAHGIKP